MAGNITNIKNVIPYIEDAISYLESARGLLSSTSIPSDFPYSSILRQTSTNILQLKNNASKLKYYANTQVSKFNEVESQNNLLAMALGNSNLNNPFSKDQKSSSTFDEYIDRLRRVWNQNNNNKNNSDKSKPWLQMTIPEWIKSLGASNNLLSKYTKKYKTGATVGTFITSMVRGLSGAGDQILKGLSIMGTQRSRTRITKDETYNSFDWKQGCRR